MKTSSAAFWAAIALSLAATPVFAVDSEANKQAPAPQGTTAPDSNAKAKVPNGAGAGVKEDTKENTDVQSPGKSEATDASKKAEEPGVVAPKSKEQANTQVPAPANTQPPSKN